MSEPPAPPVEWVAGPRHWWVPRLLIPFASLGAVAVLAVYYSVATWHFLVCACGPPPSVFPEFQIVLLISIVWGIGYTQLLSFIPSTRRIGIAPSGLIIDTGLRPIDFAWSQVRSVTRKRLLFVLGNRYRLTSQQGDRMARLYSLA